VCVYVAPLYRRNKNYAARVSYAADDAHRPPLHGFAASARDASGQTDGQSDRLTRYRFNGPFSGTTQVSRYQKGKTNLDINEARDSE